MNWLNIFQRRKNSDREIAAQRLRLVLAHDRANLSPGMLDMLKDEIITVISRHLEIDANKVEVRLTEDAREMRLFADIPLHNPRKGAI